MRISKIGRALIALGGVILVLRIVFPVGSDGADRILAFNPFNNSAGYEADYTMTVLHIIAFVLVVGIILFLRYSYPNLFTFRTFKRLCMWIGITAAGTAAIIVMYPIVSDRLEERRIRAESIELLNAAIDSLPERYTGVVLFTDGFLDTLSVGRVDGLRDGIQNLVSLYKMFSDQIVLPLCPFHSGVNRVAILKKRKIQLEVWWRELQRLSPYTDLAIDGDRKDSLSVMGEMMYNCSTNLDSIIATAYKDGEFDYSLFLKGEEDRWNRRNLFFDRYSEAEERLVAIREYLVAEIGLIESPPDNPYLEAVLPTNTN